MPIIDHEAVSDVLADAKGRIEAVRRLGWRAMDAVLSRHEAGPELALHAKVMGSQTGVDVINQLIQVVGVQAYDRNFPILSCLADALAYPSSRAATSASGVASCTTCSAHRATTR